LVRAPNDVWTADFKGWFRLGDGTRVEPLTVRDGFSRYTLAVHLMRQQTIAATLPVFRRLFHQRGLPGRIRVDNGSPFGSKGPLGLTHLSAWWIKQDIAVEFGRAGHPEDNAGHEQFHRVMKAETANPPTHTWRGQRRRTQRWVL
jgi:putative transposase